jgi:hypothetical protein
MEKLFVVLEKIMAFLRARFRGLQLRQSPSFTFSRDLDSELNTFRRNWHCWSKRINWNVQVSLDKILVDFEKRMVTWRKNGHVTTALRSVFYQFFSFYGLTPLEILMNFHHDNYFGESSVACGLKVSRPHVGGDKELVRD